MQVKKWEWGDRGGMQSKAESSPSCAVSVSRGKSLLSASASPFAWLPDQGTR